MVARMDGELFPQGLFTPQPELSDSDDVLLALETARALEMQGEIREAVRWLRRAADEAEKDGNDERVLALARIAADLSNTLGPVPSASDAPTMPPAYPPTTPPPASFEATIPPPASNAEASLSAPPATSLSAPPAAASSAPLGTSLSELRTATAIPSEPPAATTLSTPPLTERSMRIGAIRVALAEGSVRGVKSFYVERLDKGQSPPEGTMEAMLVFSSEIDESSDSDSQQRVAGDKTAS